MQALSECFTDLQENILVVVRHREEDLEPVCAVGESHRSLRDKPIIRRRDRNLLDRLRVKRVQARVQHSNKLTPNSNLTAVCKG